ncbi:MAG: thiol reductase thioredoxin [Planctomycetaceae bacterium TMED10]|nr:MAG: thiol reductase thioredoxin [Planctomycetaceae bacterium TMED10]
MTLAEFYQQGHCYADFLTQYGSENDRKRWQQVYAQTDLEPEQEALLGSFAREMHILCMAGAWCGDCAEQCPIFTVFEEASPMIHVRYVDRDAYPELKESLTICGGARVPQVVFFSEDMQQVGRYGDRTLAKYRQMAASIGGAACSSGILGETNQHAEVVREWLDEFERIQLILRTSPRLRQKHSD